MNVLAIIPARGGSKGIPGKNIKKLNGKPLIFYTINEAKKSKFLSRIVVSTDDEKIANVSRRYGTYVIKRPKKLAKDTTPSDAVIKHAINYMKKKEGFHADIVVLLQPTSPLRKVKDIDDSIRMLQLSKATSVISVAKVKTHPYILFREKNGYLKPFRKDFEKHTTRQKRPVFVCPNGSIYTFWRNTINKYNSIYGPKVKPLLIENDEYNVDIDSFFDLFVCDMVLKHWKNYKI